MCQQSVAPAPLWGLEKGRISTPRVRGIDPEQIRQQWHIFKAFVPLHLSGLSPLPWSASIQFYGYTIKYISQIRRNIKNERAVHAVNYIKLAQKAAFPESNQRQAATRVKASQTRWTRTEKRERLNWKSSGGRWVENQRKKQLATHSPEKTLHLV